MQKLWAGSVSSSLVRVPQGMSSRDAGGAGARSGSGAKGSREPWPGFQQRRSVAMLSLECMH
jgi:hypothetical protein